MTFGQQIEYPVKLGLLCALVVGLSTGCATPTEAECDPADDAFLNSLKCRNHYQNRQVRLEEEVRLAAERVAQKEKEFAELNDRHVLMKELLETLQSDLKARQQRINALKSEQGATEVQLAELQTRWNKVKQETDDLAARQSRQHETAGLDELNEQLVELRNEEAELEALLLELES